MSHSRPSSPLQPVTLGDRNDATGVLHFHDDECDQIRRLTHVITPRAGAVGPDVVDAATRDVTVFPVARGDSPAWVLERVERAARAANHLVWGYHLDGASEPAQLLVYQAPSHGYRWHHDLGLGEARSRKLSLVVQLSASDDYDGGDLEFFRGDEVSLKAPRERGSVTVFPSFVWHRVTPVTRGIRHALAAWISGPALA